MGDALSDWDIELLEAYLEDEQMSVESACDDLTIAFDAGYQQRIGVTECQGCGYWTRDEELEWVDDGGEPRCSYCRAADAAAQE